MEKATNKRTHARKGLPNVNKAILDFMFVRNIKASKFEEITGIHRSSITIMKRGVKIYLDTLYMFCVVFEHNFMLPVQQQLYKESPKCREQDPLYIENMDLKKANLAFKKENELLKKRLNESADK